MVGNIKSLIKYVKHKMQNTERYQMTSFIRCFLHSESASYIGYNERKAMLRFLRYNLVDIFNYFFVLKYNYRRISVYTDISKNSLKYVVHKGDRLYFKRDLSKKRIEELYNSLCAEQDLKSPHCYSFRKKNYAGKIGVDVGAAEGIWSLSIIKDVETLYMFECDKGWKEALSATFEPWSDKIMIIDKYVSDIEDQKKITLDRYFNNVIEPQSLVIKIDVEGAEKDVLCGSKRLLEEKAFSDILVCTYHQHDDESVLSEILRREKYKLFKSSGYMLFYWENGGYCLNYNDFRCGVIHAEI